MRQNTDTEDPGSGKAATRTDAIDAIDHVKAHYARRKERSVGALYNPLTTHVYMSSQEKERGIIRWIRSCGIAPVASKRVLEIGCGNGDNLLQLLRLGFRAENLVGNELLAERAADARHRLPAAISILQGDASELPLEEVGYDVVYQSTVFALLLEDAFQQRMANHLWALTKPGGGILWYDFIYNNPQNPAVRGIPIGRIRQLFPQGKMTYWRLTLAPPINRRVTRVHPVFYTLFNAVPWLRTHVLCWIEKPL